MSRFNDSDIGYMDSEWINFISSNQKNLENGNKERTVHEGCNGNTKE